MQIDKRLGKIEKISFGYGGYQDAMFGISFALSGSDWGVADFNGAWSLDIESTEWTEADRDRQFAETMRYANQLMKDAKVRSLDALKGIPIEIQFDGNRLKRWRILTEVR